MLDQFTKNLLDPPLLALAKILRKFSITANQLSAFGLVISLWLGFTIYQGNFHLAMILILINRLTDGLDGFLARLAGKKTTLGGFIDISNDYVFYGIVPLAFAFYQPSINSLPSVILLFGFLMTAVSFLASALVHEHRASKKNTFQKSKGFFYSFGIMEGTETIVFFLLCCLLPNEYAWMALVVAMICILTAFLRFINILRRYG
ncbi:MAG: CDP-alcohol phosphatidyltransferase family protein [Alphaproteobacteria bacterium]